MKNARSMEGLLWLVREQGSHAAEWALDRIRQLEDEVARREERDRGSEEAFGPG